MIGRIDSNPDRRRPSSGRPAALVAIAALIVFGGATTTLAQTATPRVKIQGVIPTGGTQQPSAPPSIPPSQTPDPLGEPSAMPPPVPPGAQSPVDRQVRPADVEVEKEQNPIPLALPPEGGTPGDKPGQNPNAGTDPFFLPVDRMSPGKQRVQVTVDVQASPIVNLNKETTVKLIVQNESNVDASGVSLVYQLPESMEMVSSLPPFTQIPGKPQYQWANPMLAAGGEWPVILKLKVISTKSAEHAATVTVKTGSKFVTHVQEPKLKVDVTCSPGRVLKGEQVNFQISVQNPGTGPARNVIVQARLSSGLKSGSDDIVEQTIPVLAPGQRIDLDDLTVDTVAGGEQSCTVEVRSNDVIPVPDDQRKLRTVVVTKPELMVKLDGPPDRITDQVSEYKLTVSNPGTAPAKKVQVIASLPQQGGKLVALPAGAKFVLQSRKLVWSIPSLEAGEKKEMTFDYRTSTPGLYRASAEVSSADLYKMDSLTTEVSGIAVLDLEVTQTSRIIDVGKRNIYDITIKNVGSKEATKLALKAKLTGNLKVVKSYNTDKDPLGNPETGEVLFPGIERLEVGKTITVSLEVEATASGPAGCHVFLAHADMGPDEAKVEDVESTTVTGSKPRTKPK